ncbi:MAG: epoxyqueuosine reductase QueH, partial [Desulfobacterales bacterium]
MKVLLHICCANCAIYPIKTMRADGMEVMGFFYPHNIHPYTECVKRKEALETFAEQMELKVIYQDGYDLEGFIQNVAFRESERCNYCYHD